MCKDPPPWEAERTSLKPVHARLVKRAAEKVKRAAEKAKQVGVGVRGDASVGWLVWLRFQSCEG